MTLDSEGRLAPECPQWTPHYPATYDGCGGADGCETAGCDRPQWRGTAWCAECQGRLPDGPRCAVPWCARPQARASRKCDTHARWGLFRISPDWPRDSKWAHLDAKRKRRAYTPWPEIVADTLAGIRRMPDAEAVRFVNDLRKDMYAAAFGRNKPSPADFRRLADFADWRKWGRCYKTYTYIIPEG